MSFSAGDNVEVFFRSETCEEWYKAVVERIHATNIQVRYQDGSSERIFTPSGLSRVRRPSLVPLHVSSNDDRCSRRSERIRDHDQLDTMASKDCSTQGSNSIPE